MPPILADVTPAWLAVTFSIAAAVVVFVRKGLIPAARNVWRNLSRLKDFLDDLMGEAARPGVPARPGVIESQALLAESMSRLTREMMEIRAKVTSADYNSRPNGGKSAHDALMREIKATREELADHVATSVETYDEFASAIAYLADGKAAIDNLAEAMPLVARSQPHDDDAA